MNPTPWRLRASALAATAALTLGLASCTNPGGAQPPAGDPGAPSAAAQRGPNPTDALLRANRGPFAITQRNVNGPGFNNGTLHVPTDPSLTGLGAIVVVPGFISGESSIAWYGPRIASHGFVVLTINTNTPLDFPAQRASQQNAALRWLVNDSPVKDRIDGTRLGAMGWSMGGGGTLIAAAGNPAIKVAIPLAPWNIGSPLGVRAATLVVACQSDIVAPPASMASAFYNSVNAEKGYLAIPGGHFCVTTPNDQIAKFSVAWLKRFLDDDTRYSPFVCSQATGAANYRNTCPV